MFGTLKVLGKVIATVSAILGNALLIYLVMLGMERAAEIHPSVMGMVDHALSIVLPLAVIGTLLYVVVQCVQGYKQGVQDADQELARGVRR